MVRFYLPSGASELYEGFVLHGSLAVLLRGNERAKTTRTRKLLGWTANSASCWI